MKTRTILAMAWLLCPLAAFAEAQGGSAEQRTRDDRAATPYGALLDSVDGFIRSKVASGFSGVALIADKNGVVFHKAYSGKGDSIEIDHAYAIASQAKSLTGLAIMQLDERRQLSVNDPITRYFKGVPADKRTITIGQLLNHTSGLDECGCLDGETDEPRLIDGIFKTKLGAPPGSKWMYRNENYYLLGLILEKVAKMTFRDYVQRNILDIAGMRHTGQSGQQSEKSVTMAPIAAEELKKQPVYSKDYEGGRLKSGLIGHRLGAYFSTSGDMYKLALALRGNRIISAAALERSLQPRTSGLIRPGLYWGYGWVFTTAQGRRINILNSGREDWLMNSRMYLLENGFVIIVWSRDTTGPSVDAAASVVSLKLVEMFEHVPPRQPR